MTTGLRRILATAFIAALAGLGVLSALRGRRPEARLTASAKELIPTAGPSPVAPPVRTRGPALALVGLLLLGGLAGSLYASRDAVFGPGSPVTGGEARPLAALSPQSTGPARPPARDTEIATGSLRAPDPAGRTVSLTPAVPSFDVVRVAPNGDTVVAGRAAPNATVDLLVGGRPVASTRAEADGRFTLAPPPLPPGSSEIGLRATDTGGAEQRASGRVAVVVSPSRDAQPLVALTSPDKPTVILSRPDDKPANEQAPAVAEGRLPALRGERDEPGKQDPPATAQSATGTGDGLRGAETDGPATGSRADAGGQYREPANRVDGETPSDVAAPGGTSSPAEPSVAAASPPKIVSIDAQEGGKLFVTGRATPGASLRLYLNETMIAPATVARDGTVTFTIGQGVKPGTYTVRLDLVDPATGKVRDRAEVPFTAPGPGHAGGLEYSASGTDKAGRQASNPATDERPGDAAIPAQPDRTGSLAANVPPDAKHGSSEVFVPGIETARIERGDSLWRISRRTYGEGERYTLIYDANQDQIRDPDLIYPGQVLVLPSQGTAVGAAKPD